MSENNGSNDAEKIEEVWIELVPFYVEKICPECGAGKMIQHKRELSETLTKILNLTEENPDKLHKCNVCGFVAVLDKNYPRIEHIKKQEIQK